MKEIQGMPKELPGIGTIVLPHLGLDTIERQKERVISFYESCGVIDASDTRYALEDPATVIAVARTDALASYMEEVAPRMRQGDVVRMSVEGTVVNPAAIFENLVAAGSQERTYLMHRVIAAERLPEALETGTDRNADSEVDSYGTGYERQALAEYGLHDFTATDVTYAMPMSAASEEIQCQPGQAMLVYATEALQPIDTMRWESAASKPIGVCAFIDPRLRQAALLATVEFEQSS